MKKSIETKRILIDTVKELLKTNYDIKIKDITDKAFVNIAAVNYHFGDKDRLIDIAIREILDEFKDEITTFAKAEHKSTTKTFERFLGILNDFVKNNRGLIRQLMMANTPDAPSLFSYFIMDIEFTSLINSKIMEMSGSNDQTESFAKLIILFSSVAMPVLFTNPDIFGKDGFSNGEFFNKYIQQLTKIIE